MINATGERYIIEADELESMSAGGIYVKNTGATQFGIIRSAGPQVKDPLAVGTKILLDWNATLPIKHEGTQYYVVKYSAIHAVVEE